MTGSQKLLKFLLKFLLGWPMEVGGGPGRPLTFPSHPPALTSLKLQMGYVALALSCLGPQCPPHMANRMLLLTEMATLHSLPLCYEGYHL